MMELQLEKVFPENRGSEKNSFSEHLINKTFVWNREQSEKVLWRWNGIIDVDLIFYLP